MLLKASQYDNARDTCSAVQGMDASDDSNLNFQVDLQSESRLGIWKGPL